MTAALVLRGDAFRHQARTRPWGIDWRRCVVSHREKLIAPLKARYGSCDMILTPYPLESDLLTQLCRDYQPDIYLPATPGDTQRGTALKALDVVIRANRVRNYSFVVMTRFDLEFLSVPWEYGSGVDFDKINFLWREWNEEAWNDHKRVPDAVHMLPGLLLEAFREGVSKSDTVHCMHTIWHPISRVLGTHDKFHVMNSDGFHDSNTDIEPNPVYQMVRVT